MQLCRTTSLHRVAISGGEPTLNRRWLLQFFAALNEWSQGDVRLHLDTNATILTNDYIDHLVQAGVTDIGPDLKAVRLETFQIITGIRDAELARQYLDTEWKAVKYIADNYYPGDLFMGVGLPFNPAFYQSNKAMEAEIHDWASRVAAIDDRIQVTILDYRPEFRRLDLQRPSINEMKEIKAFIEGVGLRTVVAQTSIGHLPPIHQAPDRSKDSR